MAGWGQGLHVLALSRGHLQSGSWFLIFQTELQSSERPVMMRKHCHLSCISQDPLAFFDSES
jgi:hypothetical protein